MVYSKLQKSECHDKLKSHLASLLNVKFANIQISYVNRDGVRHPVKDTSSWVAAIKNGAHLNVEAAGVAMGREVATCPRWIFKLSKNGEMWSNTT